MIIKLAIYPKRTPDNKGFMERWMKTLIFCLSDVKFELSFYKKYFFFPYPITIEPYKSTVHI